MAEEATDLRGGCLPGVRRVQSYQPHLIRLQSGLSRTRPDEPCRPETEPESTVSEDPAGKGGVWESSWERKPIVKRFCIVSGRNVYPQVLFISKDTELLLVKNLSFSFFFFLLPVTMETSKKEGDCGGGGLDLFVCELCVFSFSLWRMYVWMIEISVLTRLILNGGFVGCFFYFVFLSLHLSFNMYLLSVYYMPNVLLRA